MRRKKQIGGCFRVAPSRPFDEGYLLMRGETLRQQVIEDGEADGHSKEALRRAKARSSKIADYNIGNRWYWRIA